LNTVPKLSMPILFTVSPLFYCLFTNSDNFPYYCWRYVESRLIQFGIITSIHDFHILYVVILWTRCLMGRWNAAFVIQFLMLR